MTKIIMENHTGWGNRINWFDFNTRRIEGHLKTIPKVGDQIISKLQSGKNGVFEIIVVDPCYDPADQFFATVKDIGYENGETCVFADNQEEYEKLLSMWEKFLGENKEQ